MWTLGAIFAIILISVVLEGEVVQDLRNLLYPDPVGDDLGAKAAAEAETHIVEIDAEPKDPKLMGDGGIYVRCRTCGRDVAVKTLDIPSDASCPACGAAHFQFDVSQGG